MPNFHNWRKINSTIFKQETIESWFSGVSTSVNNEVIQPFQNASSVIDKYNQAIQNNSLTQQGWERLLAQSDDSLKAYLTSVKGSTASMTAYNVSLQGSITGFSKVSSAVQQYNALGAISKKEQQEFATAVGLTNNKLGSYLIGLNGSNASLRGYGVSLVASTAKTIGLTVATTALNAAMTMGISVIVTGLISAFTAWINKSEEITEKAQEAADKINSISESLKTNTETVENAKRRYAELAQEVENLGKITQSQGTLDNEEYEEFLDLSNQLAGVFPSLTKNYDENGNAILDLSGDVNTIVGSLDDLIQKEKELANQQIMEKFPDVFKGYAQDVSEAESKVKSAQTEFDKINNAYQQLATHGSLSLAFDTTQTGEPFATFKNEIGEDVTIGINEYTQALDELGIAYKKSNLWKPNQFGGKDLVGILIEATGDIDEAFTSKLETARNNLQYAQEQLEGQTSSIDSYLNTWLQSEYTYNKIEDDGLKTAIQNLVFDFDWDNLPDGVNEDNWTEVSEYLRRNILFAISKVQNDPTISKALSEVFTNDDLTPDEKINYIKQIQDYFGEDNAITISLATQLEDNSPLQTLHKQYDSAIEQTKKQFKGDTSAATEALKTAQENLQDEYDKIEKWGLGDYAEQIKNGTIQSVFGNVDMDNRQVIDWTTDNIEKWKDALSDIKYYDEDGNFLDSYYDQLKESAENGESCIDTVFGDMMDYIEGYDGITALSFSHIVNNDDGTFEFLGQKTAEEYLYGILDAAKQDGDMSIDHILELDKKGLENAEVYDAEGKLIGQTYIHGIISGFNENANDISMLTHFAGDFGAVNLAKQAIEDAKKMQEDFDWDSWFKENSINTKEEIDNWLEIAQAANSAAEARKRYVQGSTFDNETTISFKDAWKQYSTDESTKESAEKLKELAESGSLTVKAFEGIGGAEEYFEKIGLSAEEATKKINNLVDETKPLSTLKTSIDSLQTAYTEKKDDGVVGADTLSGMEETFGKLDYWDKYKQILGSTSSSLEKCREAQNKLATEYVNSENFLAQLTDKNKDYYISQLNDLGIKNAEEVVNKTLLEQDYDVTISYITQLALAKQLANTENLNTSGDIQALYDLAVAAEASYDVLVALGRIKAHTTKIESGMYISTEESAQYAKDLETIKNASIDIENGIKAKNKTIVNPTKNNDNSSKTDTSQVFDHIETRLEYLETKAKRTVDQITDYASKKTKDKLFKQADKDYNNLLKAQEKAAKKYKKKADNVDLSDSWKKKIQSGEYSIETVKDEDLIEAIEKYQELWDKYQSALDGATETKANIRENTKNKLESDIESYEFELSNLQAEADRLDGEIEANETRGFSATDDDYKKQIQNSKDQITQWEKEKQAYQKYLKDNKIKKTSSEYQDIQSKIQDIDANIQNAQNSQLEWNKSISELPYSYLEKLRDLLGSIQSRYEKIIGLWQAQGNEKTQEQMKKQIFMGLDEIDVLRDSLSTKWTEIFGLFDAEGYSKSVQSSFKSLYESLQAGNISQNTFYNQLAKLGISKEVFDSWNGLKDKLGEVNDIESQIIENKTTIENTYDELFDGFSDAIQDLIDKINEMNDARSKAIELEKLQQALQEARQNKTSLIYHEGYGFNYEADQSAINEAQDNLDNYYAQEQVDLLQKIVDWLNDHKGDYDFFDENGNMNYDSIDAAFAEVIKEIGSKAGEMFKGLTFTTDSNGKIIASLPHHAKGTTSAKGGWSVVGEKGWELRRLNTGDSIFPHEASKNLMEFGLNPQQMIMDNLKLKPIDVSHLIKTRNDAVSNNINIGNVDLPNINDLSTAYDLVHELMTISSDAIQRANKR